jgi:formiminotetrahydrofolate cyclodeaminase
MNFLEFDSLTIKEFTEALARKEPAPGGGCAAAVAGAMAAGLVGMVSRVAAHKTDDEIAKAEMLGMSDLADEMRNRFLDLIGLDAQAYQDMKTASEADEFKAWKNAVQIPLDIAERSLTILQFAFKAAQWCPKHTISDIVTASALAMAGVEGGASTVETNMSCSPEGAEGESYQARASEMLFQARNLKYELEAVINER